MLCGVGQVTNRARRDDPSTWCDPVGLMAAALGAAGADAGGAGRSPLLDRLDVLVAVPSFVWGAPDPAALVLSAAGARARHTRRTAPGGTVPHSALFAACTAIARGEADAVAVVGGEAIRSRDLARKAGIALDWPTDEATAAAPEDFGVPDALLDDERAAGLSLPAHTYALFEHALRRRAGLDRAAHAARLDALAARMASVAAGNEHAWLREAPAGPASSPSAANRMISLPYTKLLTSNVVVDMAAAVVVCSLEAARAAGVPEHRLVFPVAAASAKEQWFVSERTDLASSTAMRACAASLARATGSLGDVAHLDLYSCFPSAVQLAAGALGLDVLADPRAPTVTGGMTFFGGPGNNYVTHSTAQMADVLRHDPGALGLVTGLGWYASTHAWALFSTTPPATPFVHEVVQDQVDAVALRDVDPAYEGSAEIESYTVGYERDGSPSRWITSVLTPRGARRILGGTDPALAAELADADPLGSSVTVRATSVALS